MTEIQRKLFEMQDLSYRDFHARLMPTVPKEQIIGIRTPQLRRFAKSFGDVENFLKELPHYYYEENNLHAFLISEIKEFDRCILALDTFLPYVDNWATCDGLRPKIFAAYPENLLPKIQEWLTSEHPYPVRFAIEMLMCFYLEKNFDPVFPDWVASVSSEDYYVKMMVAWYFSTALAKQYDAVIPYIEQRRLSPWVHKKTIQKACESYRITLQQKEYLKKHRFF